MPPETPISIEDTFLEAARALSSARKDHMYEDLLRAAVKLVGADIGLIGRYENIDGVPHICSQAWLVQGKLLPNENYVLEGTPCETVVGRSFKAYESRVGELFPTTDALKYGINGYAAYPLENADGEMLGLLSVMTYNTLDNQRLCESVLRVFAERVSHELIRTDAELELQEREKYYRTLFNNAVDAMAIIDRDGLVVDYNKTMADLDGRARDELIGKPPPSYRSADQFEQHMDTVQRVLAGESITIEHDTLCADNSTKTVEARSVRIEYRGEPVVLRVVRDISQKRTQDKKLIESEARYRGIFEASIDGLALLDSSGVVVDANAALNRIDGFSREEVVGQLPPTFRALKNKPRFQEFLDQVLGGEQVHAERDLLCKDGSLRTTDTTSVKIQYQGRSHILVIVRDIQEQKQAARTMAQTESRYQAMFDSSLDGFVLLNRDGIVVDVNPAILEIDGFSREELIGNYPPGFRTGESVQLHVDYVKKVLAGSDIRHESRLPRKDGTYYYAEMSGTALDYGGEPHVLVVVRDVTDRVSKERALARTQARLNATVVSALDCIISTNEAGQILDFNPAAEETFGHSAHDVIGRQMSDVIVPPHMKQQHEAGMARFLATGHKKMIGSRVEVTAIRADGSEFPVELAISVSEGSAGKVFTGFLRDITEAKQAAKQRTMLEAQLRQAQKMEAIGHLTGGVAHDFNNILTGVLGYIEMSRDVLGEEAHPKVIKYLNRSKRAGEKARDLIQQMLTFSRGDVGQPRPLNLAPIVEESITLLESTVPSSIAITTNLAAKLPTIVFDPVHVEQILVNLCINARDAMDGVGKLHVTLKPAVAHEHVCSSCSKTLEGDFVELVVKDSGPGIEPALVTRIFEPFFSTKETGKGSGMGLATVHGIIHEHGGHVIVNSKKGEGTSMHVLFPAEKSNEKIIPEKLEPATNSGTKTALTGSVLVVDDNHQVAEFLEELLSDWGLDVTVFHAGKPALEHFRAHSNYSLVITDQTMPEITGLELAEALLVKKPQLPIILYTGYSEVVNKGLAEAVGIRAFVQKPLDIPAFKKTVEDILLPAVV